jgi:hypothetical protein
MGKICNVATDHVRRQTITDTHFTSRRTKAADKTEGELSAGEVVKRLATTEGCQMRHLTTHAANKKAITDLVNAFMSC